MDSSSMTDNDPECEKDAPTLKEKHELLHGILKETLASFIDYAFKHGTVLLLFTAWVLTSGNARIAIQENNKLTACLFILLVLLTIFHASWASRYHRRSSKVFDQLVSLGYMPSIYYKFERISRQFMVSICALHTIICACIIFVIWTSK